MNEKRDYWLLILPLSITVGMAVVLTLVIHQSAVKIVTQTESPASSEFNLTPTVYILNTPSQPAISSSSPSVESQSGAIEVSWDDYRAVSTPRWFNNSIAVLAGSADEIGKYSITVDISKGRFARAITAYTDEEWRIFSPKRTFAIECLDDLKMFRVSDNKLISETALRPQIHPGLECATFVKWAPNETIASFVTGDNAIYTWRSNGDAPKKIIDHLDFPGVAWSPDSQMLAVPKSVPNLQTGTLDVVNADGKVLHEFQFKPGGDGPILGWLTDDVLISHSRYTKWFYDIRSEQYLFSWTSMPTGDGIWHQGPKVSPDGRWIFLDQGNRDYESTFTRDKYIVLKEYSLYDLQEKKYIPLLQYLGNYLAYVGWNGDSSLLYVISRPAESVSASNASTPFGLLSYNVWNHQFAMLFKDVMQIAWNKDKSWAFVVYRKQDDRGNLVLEGGQWKTGTDTLIGRQIIFNQVIYQDPALDNIFQAYEGPISVAWSNNGQVVAFRDGAGQIRLMNIGGTEKVLLDKKFERIVSLRWSPDDQHLLVLVDRQAWIVKVTLP